MKINLNYNKKNDVDNRLTVYKIGRKFGYSNEKYYINDNGNCLLLWNPDNLSKAFKYSNLYCEPSKRTRGLIEVKSGENSQNLVYAMTMII